MPKPLTKPQLYRLTLTTIALQALPLVVKLRKVPPCERRPDGKFNVGISTSVLDQLQTASLPKENLSDTVLRILASRKA